ncbi:hypothetical protein L1887_10238 [Cichorium endivia]|nr:hypothetical protein L1887_10238 [Cichorium endivia]
MSSKSTSSDEDNGEGNDEQFIGNLMQCTLAYFENQAGSSNVPIRRRGANLRREREDGHERLINDYFVDDAVYASKFRRRFRMEKPLFLRIVGDLEARFSYFQQRWDARGVKGFTPIQKCTAAIRQLATGLGADSWDEYLRMSERTARDALYKFSKAIIKVYGPRYLRKPTTNDIHQLYTIHQGRHGLPGMIGSIDCMHWAWSMCPNAWRGQFMRGDHKEPTIILEAVASTDLWFWHAFFGVVGSNNDINVLDQSPVFNDIFQGISHDVPFVVNNVTYKRGYYLTDGIYPEYSVFVKSWSHPNDEKRLRFKAVQEGARKDIERAFGVLKKRFNIIYNPARTWDDRKIKSLMYACIILNNMILEYEGKAICRFDENEVLPHPEPLGFDTAQYRANRAEVRSRELHNNLRADLSEHVHRNAVEAIEIEEDEELFLTSDEEAEEYMDDDDEDEDDEDDEDDNDSYGSED